MPEALPELVWFALLFFCFAFVWAARKLITAMLSPIISLIPSVPYFGTAIAAFLHRIEQDIDNKLGSIEGGIDSLMGSSFHRFAQLNEWLWSEFKRHTTLGLLVSKLVSDLTHLYAHLRGQVHSVTKATTTNGERLRAADEERYYLRKRIKKLEHDLSKGIGDDVQPHLKRLDKELARLNHKTIPAIKAAESQADSAISDLYSWARGKAALVGVGTFALAVAAAIGADVFKAIKCPSFLSSFSKRGCGLWNGLEDLLGLFVDVTLFTNVCAILDFVSPFVSDVAAPIVTALTDVGAGLCEGGIGAPPALPEQTLYLPTSPGVTLNLP